MKIPIIPCDIVRKVYLAIPHKNIICSGTVLQEIEGVKLFLGILKGTVLVGVCQYYILLYNIPLFQ